MYDIRCAGSDALKYTSIVELDKMYLGFGGGIESTLSSEQGYALRSTADPEMHQSVTEICSSPILECGHHFC